MQRTLVVRCAERVRTCGPIEVVPREPTLVLRYRLGDVVGSLL
jgi:hypothetical protein